jgi:hypothetical protein
MKTSECRERECRAAIVFLSSLTAIGKKVPVDVESLNEEDIEMLDRGEEVGFQRARGHVSHFTSCKNPKRFSGGGR